MKIIESRLGCFFWAFSQFTILQIQRTSKNVSWTKLPLLVSLVCTSGFVQFVDPNRAAVGTCMCVAFCMLSLVDGSLSNHVVASSVLALLAITCYARNAAVHQNQLRKGVIIFCAILYTVTGIHKLNTDFFNPTHSCASMYIAGSISLMPGAFTAFPGIRRILRCVVAAAPYGAAAFELLFPIALIKFFPSSRKISRKFLIIGALFHAVLALPPSPLSVYPFSAIMVPVYVMLVPETVDLESVINRVTCSGTAMGMVVAALAIAYMQAPYLLFGERDLFEYPDYGLWGVSLVWNCLWWTALVYANLRAVKSRAVGVVGPCKTPILAKLVLACLVTFAMTPYIGLRNYPALAMFSNLRTEGPNPNSFMPSHDLFGYQKDWVEIRSSNFKPIQDMQIDLGKLFPGKLMHTLTQLGLSSEFYICPPKWPLTNPENSFTPFNVPFIEVRRRLSRGDLPDGIFVEYVRHFPDGAERREIFKSDYAYSEQDILQPLTLFEDILVSFRTFRNDYSPCRH